MKQEIIQPNLSNFIKSLRDVGYTFEIAIADILDNCIDANARNIKLDIEHSPSQRMVMFDDGIGMKQAQLIEAMRLSSDDPQKQRDSNVLGKFGLGLKTASFSQCKKLTVISKKDKTLSIRQWDLDHIEKQSEWYLLIPELSDYSDAPYYDDLKNTDCGTLVIWEKMDRYENNQFSDLIESLIDHLSITFHRFLDGSSHKKKIHIEINGNKLNPLDPFNLECMSTQRLDEEKLSLYNEDIYVKPYILPHYSKISQEDYQKYGTNDGYTKSQGFYVYRSDRLLIHGTWFGLHKTSDAHKLVRIQVEIPNSQDNYWGIDIKKSMAKPTTTIKKELKRIIKNVTVKGSKPFTGRGKRIADKNTERFWDKIPNNDGIKFGLNTTHPLYLELLKSLDEKSKQLLGIYINYLETYLPLETIQAQLIENPHEVTQKENNISLEQLKELEKLNLPNDLIELLKKFRG